MMIYVVKCNFFRHFQRSKIHQNWKDFLKNLIKEDIIFKCDAFTLVSQVSVVISNKKLVSPWPVSTFLEVVISLFCFASTFSFSLEKAVSYSLYTRVSLPIQLEPASASCMNQLCISYPEGVTNRHQSRGSCSWGTPTDGVVFNRKVKL